MIAFIKGELVEKTDSTVVLENGGIGYELFVPQIVFDHLPRIGEKVKLFTYLQAREDGMSLFGFPSKDDLAVFKLLITVNGIGPKGAIGVLSVLTADQLRFAVLSDDMKTISKAPGIGIKTAGKLILELKDKFKLQDVFEQSFVGDNVTLLPNAESDGVQKEAIQALVALGYSGTEALKAVNQVEYMEHMTAEQLLKLSLKKML